MAELVAGAFLPVIFEKLLSKGIAKLKKHTLESIKPETIEQLKNKLEYLNSYLKDVRQSGIECKHYTIESWIQEVQDLALNLDDSLDSLVAYEELKPTLDRKETLKVKVSALKNRYLAYHKTLSSNIHALIGRLNDIESPVKIGLLGQITIQQEPQAREAAAKLISWRETSHCVNDEVYGREKMKKQLIKKLLTEGSSSGNKNYEVISIVGKGGIGKTTLAQMVYNDEHVRDHFQFKSWVFVKSDMKVGTDLITDIINNSSTCREHKPNTLERAHGELSKVIKNKRFLIVLDDMWCSSVWAKLETQVTNYARGSRFIVTTRKEDVAKAILTNPTNKIDLPGLLDVDCWRLFKHNLSVDIDAEMRYDILKKCNGLPLTAKVLGGLFRMTVDNQKRNEILNSYIWAQDRQILASLRLSYHDLEPNLQAIFAYSSVLPKGCEFEEMYMILLWMAQGLVGDENIGRRYFLDLVMRSLFECSISNKKLYIMHDLVHDLARCAAGKDMEKRTRHIYITASDTDILSIVPPKADKVRTFICLVKELINFNIVQKLMDRLNCVRALILASETVDRLPDSVGHLVLLRFLEVRFPKLKMLPASIRFLRNLETLFLEECRELREVKYIGSLVKLRYLRFHQNLWESKPWEITRLTNLRSLGTLYLGVDQSNKSMIRALENLNDLHGELRVKGLENMTEDDARTAKLHEKRGVTKMCLSWGGNRDVVDDSKETGELEHFKPPNNIKECKLEGYMGWKLSSWLGDPCYKNMEAIELVNCRNCKILPSLGNLSRLKKVKVEATDAIEVIGVDVFGGSRLEELIIGNCKSLKHIIGIPVTLGKLVISECPKVNHVEFKRAEWPLATSHGHSKVCINVYANESLVTLHHIPLTVQKLKISGCQNLKHVVFGGSSMASRERIELGNLLYLDILMCRNFISLQQNLSLPVVESIRFNTNENQEAIPERLGTFTSLERLVIYACPKIRNFPVGGLPRSLKYVVLNRLNIEQPPIMEWGWLLLHNLEELEISHVGKTTDTVKYIPGSQTPNLGLLGLHSHLFKISISGWNNLRLFDCSFFPNLTILEITRCKNLRYLGESNELPPVLQEVLIQDCKNIEKLCYPDPTGRIRLASNSSKRYSIQSVERYLWLESLRSSDYEDDFTRHFLRSREISEYSEDGIIQLPFLRW